ncbi:hypothetical protein E2C01_068679 [Portunus trituberculatus]|uniref:Uncharacterized protein n=1 Tax=Portunus trituberculatus TaxID=210409 RepID=A0A5B7HSM5_PORTR|nr:hypothetical protein [Portunus trituberculatus]
MACSGAWPGGSKEVKGTAVDSGLVSKSHAAGITKLVKIGDTGEVDHGRWAAHEDQCVITRRVQML